MPDPRLKTHASHAVRHLAGAGNVLAARQDRGGPNRGNVPPWPGEAEADFHGTLSAIWIWSRHRKLSGAGRFDAARALGWSFVMGAGPRFVPDAIDSVASHESAYDCALVLWAAAAERSVGPLDERRQTLVDRAARVLAMHLGELDDLGGREFRDPGFFALAVLKYASQAGDRGLAASGRKFVERAFGMKPPPPFTSEPPGSGLFDFSSTTATRVLAVMAAEGHTPFVGAWLRERVAAAAPTGFVPRRLDEHAWNACAAWALGRAYVVSTDRSLLAAYTEIMDELDQRDVDHDGGIGRDRTVRVAETAATFYYALAVDALVTPESASTGLVAAGVSP